jgi:hypothetical protein
MEKNNKLYGLAYLFDIEKEDGTLFYFYNTKEEQECNYKKASEIINKYIKGDINVVLKKFTFTLHDNISKSDFLKEITEEELKNKKDFVDLVNVLPKIKEV